MTVTQIRGNTQIIDNTINNAKILDATLTDAKVSATAAIAYSKLNLANSIVNADINTSAAIAYSKLNLTGNITNADIAPTANIAYSKLANLTGSTGAVLIQDGSAKVTASGIASSNLFLADGSVLATGTFNLNSHSIINLATPVGPNDAASKSYVDNVAQGLSTKAACDAATTANLVTTAAGSGVGKTLTATGNGVLTVDGVSSWVDVANDSGSTNPFDTNAASRVLVKDQTTNVDNGIYIVQDKGSVSSPYILKRATDFDGSPAGEVQDGAYTFITMGTVNSDSGWVLTTLNPITVDTSAITFTQFTGAAQIIAGNGLTKTGNQLDVVSGDASLTVNADELHVHRDGSGAIGLSGSGIAVNVDGSTLDIAGNALEVKAGGITNTQVSASAGIVYSKLSLTNSIVNADINSAAGIVYSKLSLSNSIVNADINASAAIAYSKLNLTGSIVNADIASGAAIAFSKLAALTSAHILVGNGSNVATDVAVSGDVTLANTGAVTITSTALGSSGHFVTREVPSGTINGSTTVFTLANTPISGTEEVFLNGILQNLGVSNDYTISGGTITFNTAPLTGDILLVNYRK